MTETEVRVPPGLAEMQPGPELAAALAPVDIRRVTGREAVTVMLARARQVNHDTAHLLEAVREAGLALDPGSVERAPGDDGFAAEECRAALVLSRRAARRRFRLADDLCRRLPHVLLEMRSGRLDEARARAFSEGTQDVHPEIVSDVIAQLLPHARHLLLGELMARIQELVLALDPDWARRREERDEGDRRVVAGRNRSGTAHLSGRDLPLERVLLAASRIEALAATVKARGVSAPIDQVRADLFAGLLDGVFAGLTDEEIVADFVEAWEETGASIGEHPRREAAEDDSGRDGPGDDGPGDDGPGSPAAASPDPIVPVPTGPAARPRSPANEGPATPSPAGTRPSGSVSPTPQTPVHRPPPPDSARTPRGLHRKRGEVRGRLTTLLELDDLPGELCGWGPVHACRLRALVGAHTSAAWRWVVTDPEGRALAAGSIPRRLRPRPPGADPSGGGAGSAGSGDVAGWVDVELAVPVDVLVALDPDRHPAWRPLLLRLQAWAVDARSRVDPSLDPFPAPGVPTIPDVDVDAGAPNRGRDPHARFANAALERAVRLRDRYCVGAACRRPAFQAEIDHTHDHARGGPTEADNLGCLCTGCHDLKSRSRWTLTQPRPGLFVWRSPAGVEYDTGLVPVLRPLPGPRPPRDGRPRRLRGSDLLHPSDGGDSTGRRSSLWEQGVDPHDPDACRRPVPPPVAVRYPVEPPF